MPHNTTPRDLVPSRMPAPLAILGYGHFGRTLADLAAAANLPWLACDPDAETHATIPADHRAADGTDLTDLTSRARTLILCIPVSSTEAALAQLRPHLSPDHLILDVGSVKLWPARVMAERLGADIPWCATHPLFGPVSLSRNERPLRVVVCPNDLHPTAAARARALYESLGCEVTKLDADTHDRHMAATHAMAFFIARAMLDLDSGNTTSAARDLLTPSFRAMAQTVDTVRGDAGHLFDLIQQGNPHAAAARRDFIDALTRIDRSLLTHPDDGASLP